MTIGFADAWGAFEIGDSVVVTDGEQQPSGAHELKVWRSRNFSGELTEKIDGPPRRLRIQMPESGGIQVAYTLTEGDGTSFTAGEGAVSLAAALAILRAQRDELIVKTDFVEFSRRLTGEQKSEGLAYRDALFDLPETTDPVAPEWPTPPAWLDLTD